MVITPYLVRIKARHSETNYSEVLNLLAEQINVNNANWGLKTCFFFCGLSFRQCLLPTSAHE